MKKEETTKHDTKDDEKLTNIETIRGLLPRFEESVLDVSNLKVIDKIGEGAFAHVYKCIHNPTKQELAVKIMKPKIFSRESDVYDFFLEAQLLRKIRHPNIVPFKGICFGDLDQKKEQIQYKHRNQGQNQQHESLCVVTEFMNGGSLKEWIYAKMKNPNRRVYSRKQAIKWMIQIAKGLVYLHGTPFVIVHRDLKPENILLQKSDPQEQRRVEYEAKIADFGLSVVIARKSGVPSSNVDKQERFEGIDSGTLPELLRHGKRGVKKNPETLRRALKGVSTCLHAPRYRAEQAAQDPDASTGGKDLGASCGGKDLTGRTGSLMYMAPEVLRYKKYNEKVDVFSYGVILYEILQGFTLLSTLPKTATISDVKQFASRVADGYRMQIPADWPQPIKALIEDCWNGRPSRRPTMKQVVRRLEEMYEIGTFAEVRRPVNDTQKKQKRKHKGSCFHLFRMFPCCSVHVHKDSIKTPV
eukprot:g1126.t1